ncbi:hypothetical protein [Oligoflexus tunisiensis]|uniref:hypothetical protein n=1 Tax=Oligoflexus tunisiensis TaxID=708132 RepID=UPI00114D2174|nr:hypothetical protein [Oligoflexus tunisiensis]
MTDQKTPDLPKDLINDAEFVALIEQEMREQNADISDDELQKKRLWQRLEADIGSTASPVKKHRYWPWALAAALLLGLVPWLQNQRQQDQWKGGESKPGLPANALTLTRDANQIKASLSETASEYRFLALVWATEPFHVLWQGPTPTGIWTFELNESRQGRVCAILADDEAQLTQKINIIRELKEVPVDAPCSEVTPPSFE